jgi:hypothetical protein
VTDGDDNHFGVGRRRFKDCRTETGQRSPLEIWSAGIIFPRVNRRQEVLRCRLRENDVSWSPTVVRGDHLDEIIHPRDVHVML